MQHIPASAQAIYNTIFALFFLEEYLNLLSFVTLFTSKFRAEVWSVMQCCTTSPYPSLLASTKSLFERLYQLPT